MKIWEKIKIVGNGSVVKKYKLLGITLARKEKTPLGKRITFFGLKVSLHFPSKNTSNQPQRLTQDLNIVSKSLYFNKEWFIHQNDLRNIFEPYQTYIVNSSSLNPGPTFNSREYLLLNPDVKVSGLNPLVHYEQWGRNEGRLISLTDKHDLSFPCGTENIREVFNSSIENNRHLISVFATYSSNGRVPQHVIYLLKHVKEISDYVVLVSDNPLFRDELAKIHGYTDVVLCERHEEYDFGSYKRGFQYLVQNKLLTNGHNLLFINDSCFGPVYPFTKALRDFEQKKVDFYGLSYATFPRNYIQSFFYIFTPKVYLSKTFGDFIESIKKEISPAHVVRNYEMQFTQVLFDAGFSYSTFVSNETLPHLQSNNSVIPTKYTHTLLEKWEYPLVKMKVLNGSTCESPLSIMEHIKVHNGDLYNIIVAHRKCNPPKIKFPQYVSKYTLYRKYDETITRLKQKVSLGQRLRVVFLVNMTSMFPAEGLMELMISDPLFDVALYVIPDIRFGDEKKVKNQTDALNALRSKYPFVACAMEFDTDGMILEWKDVINNADLVCYPSPYDLSYSLYNPYYAAQKGILSIHLNYGFFRSKYDRYIYQTDNYNNFWRVFLETPLNLEEYKRFGQCGGANAIVSGYSKMDKLSLYTTNNSKRKYKKTIIIAPHHSVSGGCNDILALSNFERYANLFLRLPLLYPEIDFIFRPHPVLFTVLRQNKHWGSAKVDEYLNKLKQCENVTYSTRGDYLDVFAKSDAIIQDCGSYLPEYLYTQKPGCYMLKSPEDIERKFVELGKQCLEQYYLAYNEDDILEFINNVVLKGIDPKKTAREHFASEVIMKNYPNATRCILENLKQCFVG